MQPVRDLPSAALVRYYGMWQIQLSVCLAPDE